MGELATIALAAWLAGVAAFAGGLLARFEPFRESESKREIIHGIVAFGGGILVAAVAFALAPEAVAALPPAPLAAVFCLGGCAVCALDVQLNRRGAGKPQFVAMLMDFVPEAIALGALFASDRKAGILLAGFIAAQNLPEGFNAYREITGNGAAPKATLGRLFVVGFAGPVAACGGYLLLSDHHQWTAAIMAFAAGGILYLIFQDIAPQAKMRRHWTPTLGAVLGFAVGMAGQQLLGA